MSSMLDIAEISNAVRQTDYSLVSTEGGSVEKTGKSITRKYVGNRPIKLRKSMWKERNLKTVKKKDKEKQFNVKRLPQIQNQRKKIVESLNEN
uniref:Uncharacterized protein n=1 Tax=Romanomermis culicivorax TaxID=13658 RepID=A0A915I4F2_ROMCU